MKYCTKCGNLLNDNDNNCPVCGKIQNPEIIITTVRNTTDPSPVWPLVIAIIFLVISLVDAFVSATLFLSLFVFPVVVISLIFSIVALRGAKKNEKVYGSRGPLTAARVLSIISIILSAVAISIGIVTLGIGASTTAYINKYTNTTQNTYPNSNQPSFSYQPTTQSENQNTVESKESVEIIAPKIKIIKYDMAITNNNILLCWYDKTWKGSYILSKPVQPGTKPYGIGIVARKVENKYLYISEVSYSNLGDNIVLDETITFLPDGEVQYILSGYIIYENNGELRVVAYEKNTGSVVYDLPIRFIYKDGNKKTEITGLKYYGVYREYSYGIFTYSNYDATKSILKYRLSFMSEDEQEYK